MEWKRPLLLLFFLSGVNCAWAASLSDLLTQTRTQLRDTATNTERRRFSDSQLTTFLNNAQREVNARAWCVVGSSNINLVSGTTEYSLPSDFILPLRVTVNNLALVERTFTFFDEANGTWISETGPPREYYVRVDSSIVSNVTRESIGIHPVSTSAAIMSIQYLQQPSDLSNGSDIPFSGNVRLYPYHYALAYYATYMGYLADGKKEEAALYYQSFASVFNLLEGNEVARKYFNPNLRGTRAPVEPKQ